MDLASVFNNHLDADRMAPADVRNLFRPPPGFSTCLRHTHQVLLGPRGSGKSIALKWLAFMPKRPDLLPEPRFYGIWMGMGRFDIDYFRQLYDRTGDQRPFIAYFNLKLLGALLDALERDHKKENERLVLPAAFSSILRNEPKGESWDLSMADLDEARFRLDDYLLTLKASLSSSHLESPTLPPVCTLDHTVSLMGRFQTFCSRVSNLESVALLLDGVDHLGALGVALLPLLSKDESYADWLLVKATCRELPTYLYSGTEQNRHQLEEGRDFNIVPLGVFDSEAKLRVHLEGVMEQRFRLYLDEEAVDIRDILPADTAVADSYTGFEGVSRFSGGNVLTFLETCGLALQFEQESLQEDVVDRLSPAAQRKGMRQKAEIYLNQDLDYQVGAQAPELRDFLRATGKYLERQHNGSGSRVLELQGGFADARSQELNVPFSEAIARLAEFRYLIVERPRLVPLLRRLEKTIPLTMELSPTLAPLFGLRFERAKPTPIASEDIDYWVNLLHTEREEQGILFPCPYAFLSRTGDDWGDLVQRRIVEAYGRVGRSEALRKEFGSADLTLTSFKDVERRLTGNFRDNVLKEMRDARYVVVDATYGISSGICVELGIAAGLRKPLGMCWFEDKPFDPVTGEEAFEETELPDELRGFDIKVRDPSKEAFYRWYFEHIHKPCLSIEEMCAFKGSHSGCDCHEITKRLDTVYVSIDPRNQDLDDFLVKQLQARRFKVVRDAELGPALSSEFCHRVRGVGGALIDITKPTEEPSWCDRRGDWSGLTPRLGGAAPEVRPLVEAGYMIGSGTPYGLFYDEQRGYLHSTMLPERRMSIPRERAEIAISSFVEWFIREQLERRK